MEANRRKAKGPRLRRALGWAVVVWIVLLFWPDARNMMILHARLLSGTAPRHAGYLSPWFRPGG